MDRKEQPGTVYVVAGEAHDCVIVDSIHTSHEKALAARDDAEAGYDDILVWTLDSSEYKYAKEQGNEDR